MDTLTAIAVLFGLGIGAQWLAWRLNLPAILLLLGFGFVAGPDRLGWVDPTVMLGDHLFPLVSLSVGIILFEGGLSLNLREIEGVQRVVWKLVSLGALVTWVLGAMAAYWILGLPTGLAILLGAVLVVSGPTVVLPLLRHIKPQGISGAVLKWEGIVIDPIGAVAALLVYECLEAGSVAAAAPLASIGMTLFAGTVCGVAGAALLIALMRRYLIPDHLHVTFALAVVVAAFAAANAMHHESGLLAVTLLGVILANQRWVSVEHILEFKENLRVLLISSLFLLLSARLRNDEIALIEPAAFVFLAVLLFIVRPAAVWACTRKSALTRNERLFLAWLCPRGIVAAAVASVFALGLVDKGVSGAEELVPLTFFVIVGTVVVYGLTSPILARRLGLSEPNPQGVLFVGASPWVREVAFALHELGVPVRLADTNRENIAEARMRGLSTWRGNVLEEEAHEGVDLGGMGRVVALTPNNQINRLVMLHFLHDFGREELYRLPMETDKARDFAATPGRTVFGGDLGFREISRRFQGGAEVKATRLTEEFSLADFRAHHGEEAVHVATVAADGRLRLNALDSTRTPGPGDTVVALVPADPAPAS